MNDVLSRDNRDAAQKSLMISPPVIDLALAPGVLSAIFDGSIKDIVAFNIYAGSGTQCPECGVGVRPCMTICPVIEVASCKPLSSDRLAKPVQRD